MPSPRDTNLGTTALLPVRPALPAERAFVVQLRADADLACGVVRGRIEHVVSGRAVLFESLDELLRGMCDAERTWASTRPRSDSSTPAEKRRKESSP